MLQLGLLFVFLAAVWTNLSAQAIPPGFEAQRLDTTEGRILKPKGWYYSHSSDRHSLSWILSKEDPKAGRYETGMRIQMVPEASKAARVPASQFVERFIAQKQQAAEVKRLCPASRVGDFQRRCLETVEGRYRILYSLSWTDEKDMFVITTFGAPVGEWEQARQIADRMNDFELIGAGFWKK